MFWYKWLWLNCRSAQLCINWDAISWRWHGRAPRHPRPHPSFQPIYNHQSNEGVKKKRKRKIKWVKERNKEGRRESARASAPWSLVCWKNEIHFGFDFSWRALVQNPAFVGVTEANNHAPKQRGRGRERWDACPIQMWFSYFAGLLSLVLERERTPLNIRRAGGTRVSTVDSARTRAHLLRFSWISWVAKHANRCKRVSIYGTKMNSLRFAQISFSFLRHLLCCNVEVNVFTLVPLRELSSMHAQGHHPSSHSHDRVSARDRRTLLAFVSVTVCAFAGLPCTQHRAKRGASDGFSLLFD